MKRIILALCLLLFPLTLIAGVTFLPTWSGLPGGTPACVGYIGTNTDVSGDSEGTSSAHFVIKYTHSGTTCKVNTVEFYEMDGTAFTAGIYADNGSGTGPATESPLVDSSEITPDGTDQWWSGSLDSEFTFENGTTYWISQAPNGTVRYLYDTVTSGDVIYDSSFTYTSGTLQDWVAGSNYTRAQGLRFSYE